MTTEIQKLTTKFVSDMSSVIETEAAMKAGAIVIDAFKLHPNAKIARAAGAKPSPKRRKGPIQLCPVPSCKGRAAPSLGMVCSDHRNVPKAKIKAYRAARRAKKAGK